mgnify:CR=1 FL=1
MKILLVEDDLEISKLLAEFLQEMDMKFFANMTGFMYWIACGKIIST